jgi:hypothetical protein
MNTSVMGKEARPNGARPFIPPGLAFAAVLVLWIAFGVTVAANPAGLGELRERIEGLWLPLQVVVWLVFLPWMLALRTWQADWAIWLRLGIVTGLAVATVAAFLPRWYEG